VSNPSRDKAKRPYISKAGASVTHDAERNPLFMRSNAPGNIICAAYRTTLQFFRIAAAARVQAPDKYDMEFDLAAEYMEFDRTDR
jgi:hypothetical protein